MDFKRKKKNFSWTKFDVDGFKEEEEEEEIEQQQQQQQESNKKKNKDKAKTETIVVLTNCMYLSTCPVAWMRKDRWLKLWLIFLVIYCFASKGNQFRRIIRIIFPCKK